MKSHHHSILALHSLLACTSVGNAQELVPNGSFEEVLICPDWQSQLDRTAFWFDPSEGGSPDYYHACGEPLYALPDNTVGFQESVDGQGYVGIFLWIANVLDEWREYIEVGLTSPLIPGQCYQFRMHANLADFSDKTTDDLGVFFSMDSVLSDDPYPPGMAPQLALAPGTFLDRESWTVLEGAYIANGGERFLMIGNFLWDAETSVQVSPGGTPNTGDFVYCLVDSVSLTPCGAIALGMEGPSDPIVLGAMPITDELHLVDAVRGAKFTVCDLAGRRISTGVITDGMIDARHWAIGTYVVEVATPARIQRATVMKR